MHQSQVQLRPVRIDEYAPAINLQIPASNRGIIPDLMQLLGKVERTRCSLGFMSASIWRMLASPHHLRVCLFLGSTSVKLASEQARCPRYSCRTHYALNLFWAEPQQQECPFKFGSYVRL